MKLSELLDSAADYAASCILDLASDPPIGSLATKSRDFEYEHEEWAVCVKAIVALYDRVDSVTVKVDDVNLEVYYCGALVKTSKMARFVVAAKVQQLVNG